MTKKRIIISVSVAFALLIIAVGLIFGMDRTDVTPEQFISLGEKYLSELNYEQALVQFLKVIEIEPMNPRGYTGAAEAYIGLEQKDSAIEILRQGLEITSDETLQSMLKGLTTDMDPISEDTQSNSLLYEDVNKTLASELTLLFQKAALDSKLIDFDAVSLFGYSIEGIDIFTFRDALSNHVAWVSDVNEYEETYGVTGQKERYGTSIRGMQYHEENYVTYVTYSQHYINQSPLQTMVGDIYTFDSLEVFFDKMGFSNAQDISLTVKSYFARKYQDFDDIFDSIDSFSKRINEWEFSFLEANIGTVQLENGEYILTRLPISFSHSDHNVKFHFTFDSEDRLPDDSGHILDDLYLQYATVDIEK